jgi:CRISPR-associated protein Cas5a/b/c
LSYILVDVVGTFHWGFSIQSPEASKAQLPLSVPPPTTLVGALSYPLFRTYREYRGETLMEEGKLYSITKLLYDFIECTSIAFEGEYSGYPWQDISKLVTVVWHYHRKNRRGIPKYETGALPTGKVYTQGRAKIIYVLREGFVEKEKLESAAWQITRIGSKESIFSVEKIRVSEVEPKITEGKIKTRFYFPMELAKEGGIYQMYFLQEFWIGGYGEEKARKQIYVVPGQQSPLDSYIIDVEPRKKVKYYVSDGDNVLAGFG